MTDGLVKPKYIGLKILERFSREELKAHKAILKGQKKNSPDGDRTNFFAPVEDCMPEGFTGIEVLGWVAEIDSHRLITSCWCRPLGFFSEDIEISEIIFKDKK